jgi:hypothetical protein
MSLFSEEFACDGEMFPTSFLQGNVIQSQLGCAVGRWEANRKRSLCRSSEGEDGSDKEKAPSRC